MDLKVKLTEEEYNNLLERAKSSVRHELTEKAIKEYFEKHKDLNIMETLRLMNIHGRAEDLLKEMKEGGPFNSRGEKREFCKHDRFLISIYTLMYEVVR